MKHQRSPIEGRLGSRPVTRAAAGLRGQGSWDPPSVCRLPAGKPREATTSPRFSHPMPTELVARWPSPALKTGVHEICRWRRPVAGTRPRMQNQEEERRGSGATWLRRGSGAARPGARTIRVSAPGVRSGRAQEAVDRRVSGSAGRLRLARGGTSSVSGS